MTPVVEFAAAKVNLALHVTGRRLDGYHDLDTLVAFADVGDSVTMAPATTASFAIDGPMAAGLATGDDNLVVAAARAFAASYGPLPPLAIRLTKRLPVASGIGGGSADAAAALRALCRLSARDPADPDLARLALGLGADVPMCLTGRPARITGIGERISPTGGRTTFGLLLVNPGVGLSTPSVFAALGQRDNPPIPALPTFASAADLADFLAGATRNDLETPARTLAPVIADVLAAIAALPGVRLARMSGSGATCFGLVDSKDTAATAAAMLSRHHPGWWIAAAASTV